MFIPRNSPPPLIHSSSQSDRESSKSRDTTPATPISTGPAPSRSSCDPAGEAAQTEQPPWRRRLTLPGKTTTSLCIDLPPASSGLDDPAFELFPSQPRDHSMAINASLDAHISNRQTSTSPRGNQPSHLTAALRGSEASDRPVTNIPAMENHRSSLTVPESSEMTRFENGARPISVKGRPVQKDRRESLAQSIGMGMSWGGASVGSWIRDEYVGHVPDLKPC